ncbi:MAG TPA: carboxypeptidase-like regulatory domain-containing protein [Verrucomicrobiae bacterium]|nr:carboxypeptidase-like regulatory domain-containing protein [Verrucomicrobiae bacterium]
MLAQSQDTPAAQEHPASSSAVQADESGSIAGTVVNSVTGKPLEGVHVRLWGFGPDKRPFVYGAVSNASGRFSITGVPPASYLVLPERLGFVMVPGRKKGPAANGTLQLKPGEMVPDLTLEMTLRSIISGHVLDEYGDPAMNIQVAAIPLSSRTVMAQMYGSATTDDHGYFRMPLPPGNYYIKATDSETRSGIPEIRTDGTAEGSYVETYYPGVTDKSAATLVEAKAGYESSSIEIRLARSPVLSISGEIAGIPDGVSSVSLTTEQGTSLSKMHSSGTQGWSVINGKLDGKFMVGHLSSGFYRIYAHCTKGEQPLQSQIAEITLTDSSVENVSLTLAPGFEVSGTVKVLGALSAAPAVVRSVQLQADGPSGPSYGPSYASEPVVNGGFRIRNVFAGRYRVLIEPLPEGGFVKSVQVNGSSAPAGIVDFSSGVFDAKLEIMISPNGGRISGRVESDKGTVMPVLTRVFLFPDQEPAMGFRDWKMSQVTPDGGYSFSGLPPGKYRVVIPPPFTTGDINDTLQQYRTSSEVIEIKEGEKIVKNIKAADEDGNEAPK